MHANEKSLQEFWTCWYLDDISWNMLYMLFCHVIHYSVYFKFIKPALLCLSKDFFKSMTYGGPCLNLVNCLPTFVFVLGCINAKNYGPLHVSIGLNLVIKLKKMQSCSPNVWHYEKYSRYIDMFSFRRIVLSWP